MNFFTGIYKILQNIIGFLLITIYNYVGNFGIAIILVTILSKIVLFPLTLKQDKAMKNMKKLHPKLEELKNKYANDKTTLNVKTMQLYKENNVNPAGGCLPILIQLPILWALFGVLRGNIIPPDSTFIWLELSKPDPYFILPILNGATAFIQQKIMGNDDNPQMKNMMYFFPILMIFISYKLPSGLQLYWFVSSLLGIIQQYFIMNRKD